MSSQTSAASYAERTYAGVLGKIIGVYLGRPFEGWTYERISADLEANASLRRKIRDIEQQIPDLKKSR